MPRPGRHHVLTFEDYLEVERASGRKHEFSDGQVLLMAGGSARHNAIVANALAALVGALRGGPCRALASDQRLATGDGLYTYADASVFCGPIQIEREQTATNPLVVIEVLSDSTRDYDRTDKLDRYRSIPSLRHVLLVEQGHVDVEHWHLTDTGWQRRVHTDLSDAVHLDPPGVDLPVADLYAGTDDLR